MRARWLSVVTAGLACLSQGAGAGAQSAPAPRPVSLTSTVVVRTARSASIDVRLTHPVTLDPRDLFDPPRNVFDADRVGAGYALVSLRYASYPPALVGVVAPQAERSRRIQLAFGDDRAGNDVLETLRLPAGRYRLYVFTPGGATTVRFRLPGLAAGTRTLTPSRRETIGLRRADAPRLTATGAVLADGRATTAAQTLAVMTAAARITAPRGYDSYWCRYDGGDPPAGLYLPHCLGADDGTGVGNGLPAIDYDYSGLSAFVGLPRGRWAVSRSVEAAGRVEDQTSYFVWIPMPLAMPSGSPVATVARGR